MKSVQYIGLAFGIYVLICAQNTDTVPGSVFQSRPGQWILCEGEDQAVSYAEMETRCVGSVWAKSFGVLFKILYII